MRICYSKDITPVILDSLKGHNKTHATLLSFLQEHSDIIEVAADISGSPKPDFDELLPGLSVKKSTGPIKVTLTPKRWIAIEGSPSNLKIYINNFMFGPNEELNHHHPENVNLNKYWTSDSLHLIIEANSNYLAELRSKSHEEPQGPNLWLLLQYWAFLFVPLLCVLFMYLSHGSGQHRYSSSSSHNMLWWVFIVFAFLSGELSFRFALRFAQKDQRVNALTLYWLVMPLIILTLLFWVELVIHGK